MTNPLLIPPTTITFSRSYKCGDIEYSRVFTGYTSIESLTLAISKFIEEMDHLYNINITF